MPPFVEGGGACWFAVVRLSVGRSLIKISWKKEAMSPLIHTEQPIRFEFMTSLFSEVLKFKVQNPNHITP